MNWFRTVPKWVLAVILFGVSVSFIFWGIPNDVFSAGTTPLIRVGETAIYAQEFQQHYTRYLQERSEQERHQISTDEGRARNLDYAARERLISRLLVEKKARELGLSISTGQVVDELRKVPGLTDGKGNISPQALAQILQNNQMSEAVLIAQVQSDMAQQQLIGSVLAKLELPPEMQRALQRFRLERRVAEYVLIDPTRAGQVADPNDADLKKYYEAHIAQFTAPEYRGVTVVTASAKDVAAQMEIKDEEIKAAYDLNKARYETPEKRKIEQIRFPTEAKARAARAELDAGKSFEDIAKAAGYKAEDIQLGELSAGDTTVPAEAFTIELNSPSQPLKGPFGWVIVRATSSTPGTVKTLEEARQEIRDILATERAKDQVSTVSNKYEDERGEGKTIEEAAGAHNLKLTKIAAIDKSGKTETGQTVESLPLAGDFLSRVFSSESGAESGIQETNDGVYYEFRIDSVRPAAKKPFESVRNDVLTMWRAEQQRQRLQAIADGLVKRGNAGETMAQIAGPLGVAPLKSDPLPRFPATAVFSQDALAKLFDTKVGAFFSGAVSDGKSIVVARVDSSMQQADPAGSPQAGLYAEILNQAFVGDVATQFTTALRRETCSQKTVWERVFGSRLHDCVDEEQFKRVHSGE